MIILGIETSCDETAAAVVEKTGNRIQILSNVIASSAGLQAKYGGIIPEQAAREQIKSIIPVIEEALDQAFPGVIPANAGIQLKKSRSELDPALRRDDKIKKLDALAVTYGPGLIGSLLVGVETAKTLSLIWNKPLIPVNHLLGHFWANWIQQIKSDEIRKSDTQKTSKSEFSDIQTRRPTDTPILSDLSSIPTFPCIGLLVSGGHTDLVLFKNEQDYEYLGGTRDDAAGECFDKCARLLGLPYPGGPKIAKLASQGSTLQGFELPRPMIHSKDFDFSFSGLKTAVANIVKTFPVIPSASEVFDSEGRALRAQTRRESQDSNPEIATSSPMARPRNDDLVNLCASIEQAIVDVLVEKTVRAAKKYKVEHIMIAGGVASNQKLTSDLESRIKNLELRIKLHVPPANLCTDNAAMIASRGFFEKSIDPLKLQVNPNLAL